jgi:TPR repeat protein
MIAPTRTTADAREVRLFGLRCAAEQGDAGSQFDLGWKYEHGEGVQKDETEAARLYGQAATQGHADAQKSLGVFYAFINGVEEHEAEARLGCTGRRRSRVMPKHSTASTSATTLAWA